MKKLIVEMNDETADVMMRMQRRGTIAEAVKWQLSWPLAGETKHPVTLTVKEYDHG